MRPQQLFATSEKPSCDHVIKDRWLAMSALQKSVRRGLIQHANLAASVLLDLQPAALWRRMVIVALEDIGIADLQLVQETLAVAGNQRWRTDNGGDWHHVSVLLERMCHAVKSRDACEVLVTADLHPDLKQARSLFSTFNTKELSEILVDPDKSLETRVLAAWNIAGTKRFPATNLPVRTGNLADLWGVYDHIGILPDVLSTARLGAARTAEGHALSIPLIWLAAAQSEKRGVRSELPEPRIIKGWPDFAFDMHTRIGKRALAIFLRECKELADLLTRELRPQFREPFIGTLMFRLEGEKVDRRLNYEGSVEILASAEEAHLTHTGFPRQLIAQTMALASRKGPLLADCRDKAAANYSV